MGVVYATTDCVVAWSQGETPLSKGDVWDDASDLVSERPDLFASEPTRVRGRQADQAPAAELDAGPVEQATARPGAKRAGRQR